MFERKFKSCDFVVLYFYFTSINIVRTKMRFIIESLILLKLKMGLLRTIKYTLTKTWKMFKDWIAFNNKINLLKKD